MRSIAVVFRPASTKEATPMIGPHIIFGIGGYESLIRTWQPRVALLLDPSGGAAAQFKSWSPGTFLIGRVFREDSEIEGRILADPDAAATWAADIVREAAQRNPEIDAWQFNNEVAQASPVDINQLALFSIRYIDLLAQDGLKAAIGCFSVGRPEAPVNDGGAAWNAFVPAMRYGLPRGALLLLHAYGAPQIFLPAREWYLQRFERVVRPSLPADVQEMPYVYGEYGCDMGIHQPGLRKGWTTGYSGDHRAYAAELHQAAEFLADQSACRGACVFTLGSNPDWTDFDINGEAAWELARVAWPAPKARPAVPVVEHKPIPAQPAGDLRDLLFRHERARPLVDYASASFLLRRIIADGFVPTSAEFGVQVRSVALRAQRAEHPTQGGVRIYCARADRPEDVGFFSA
jgi:hypothetical protein